MRSYSLSRIDILHIILILITQLTLCLFAAFAIHPLAGLLTCIFTFGLVPLVNDIVAKDRNDPHTVGVMGVETFALKMIFTNGTDMDSVLDVARIPNLRKNSQLSFQCG